MILKRLHREQDGGGTLILGLAFLSLLVVPLMGIMWSAAEMTNSSQTANGAAYSVAYGMMNRAVDLQATGSPDARGGVILRQPDSAGDPMFSEAYDVVGVVSQIAQPSQMGNTLALNPVPDKGRYSPTGQPQGYQPPVGLVNVTGSPEANRLSVMKYGATQCSGGWRGDPDVDPDDPPTACWTDFRAQHYFGHPDETLGQTDPLHASGVRNSSWDHYASGAEAEVKYSQSFWNLGNVDIIHRGVASFARPCVEGSWNCTQ